MKTQSMLHKMLRWLRVCDVKLGHVREQDPHPRCGTKPDREQHQHCIVSVYRSATVEK